MPEVFSARGRKLRGQRRGQRAQGGAAHSESSGSTVASTSSKTTSSSRHASTVDSQDSWESASAENESLLRRVHRYVDEYSEVMRRERASSNPLNAFAPKPINTAFDSQQEEEHVVLLLRKHPITQLRWIFIAFLLILVPNLFPFLPVYTLAPPLYQLAVQALWFLLVTGFVIESFLGWFFNVYIITDERVVDVDFLSLIYKNVSSAKIDNIEDVTATTGGALRSVFNFGTVTIQTAAAQREFEFTDVPQPAKVTKLVNEMLLEEEREKIEGRVN